MIAKDSLEEYSVPQEARNVFIQGISNNPKITKDLPHGSLSFASKIVLTGTSPPSIPINWRFAESATALKMLEACLIADLVQKKYNTTLSGATINTDHASLFAMSTLLYEINPGTPDAIAGTIGSSGQSKLDEKIPNYDSVTCGHPSTA